MLFREFLNTFDENSNVRKIELTKSQLYGSRNIRKDKTEITCGNRKITEIPVETTEENQHKIDWTKAWCGKYPVFNLVTDLQSRAIGRILH